MNETFSFELAMARYNDEVAEDVGAITMVGFYESEGETRSVSASADDVEAHADWDAMPIVFTARAGKGLNDTIRVFAGAGVGYYFFDGDVEWTNPGDFFSMFEPSASGRPDDEFGYHLIVGGSIALTENLSLEAEYRYVFLDLTVEAEFALENQFIFADAAGVRVADEVEIERDFNHGILRVALNYLF